MNNNVIYRARIQAKMNRKAVIIGLILFVFIAAMGTLGKPDEFLFFVQYNTSWTGDDAIYSALLIGLVCLIIFTFPLWFYKIGTSIAVNCSLIFEEGQIKGQLKTLFGKKNLQLPLDHLDNVMVSHGLLDKLRGGKTLLISSNRGLIKFHYVQNADEFARVAMEKIEEVKKKTIHNPAPAPTAAPVQPTGNDTMEKLDSLKKMLENGLITQEEFDAKRKELLEKL